MGGGGRARWVRLLLSRNCNKPSSKTEGTFVTPMRDFDVRSPRKSAGRNQTNHLLPSSKPRWRQLFASSRGLKILNRAPPPEPKIFRGNLSLPDSGWPRFVRMFDLSSANGWTHCFPWPTPSKKKEGYRSPRCPNANK